jgi:hypothetical protein
VSAALDATLLGNPFGHLETDDDSPTLIWERPLFFGERVGPYPADKPLPGRVSSAVGSTERTRAL